MRKSEPTEEHSAEALIGVFWAVRGKLVLRAIPASEGAQYGDFLTFEPSHYDAWTELQRQRQVSADAEYEEFPRGRVSFNQRNKTFLLLADRCILKDQKLVNQLFQEMNLSSGTTSLGGDSHYRCFRCLGLS